MEEGGRLSSSITLLVVTVCSSALAGASDSHHKHPIVQIIPVSSVGRMLVFWLHKHDYHGLISWVMGTTR